MPYKNKQEAHRKLKHAAMSFYGGRCVYPGCEKNVDEHLDELELAHPNGNGNKHRQQISNGHLGIAFYAALKRHGWPTDYEIVVLCRSHHTTFDKTGQGNPMYGRRHSEESNRKNRESQLGEKSHAWKGDQAGIRAKYIRYLKYPEVYPFTEDDRVELRTHQKEYQREYRKKMER